LNWDELLDSIASKGWPYLLVAIVVAVAVWIQRDNHWQAVIENAPVTRDSVVVRDTVSLPPVVAPALIDTVEITVIDSIIAAFDSTEIRELVAYLASPAYIDTLITFEDYALDLRVDYSPIYRTFRTSHDLYVNREMITETRLIYKEPEWWQKSLMVAGALAVGYGVAKEDWWVAGAGAVGTTITLVTF